MCSFLWLVNMYYYLNGVIVDVNEEYAVIDVHGVGYKFFHINQNDYTIGEQMLVYTLHIVREDDELFVGFKDLRSKDVFTKLISVKGIGPKTAVSALQGIRIDDFLNMIALEDIKSLKKLPGIGPKAAAQIILDLKGSLAKDMETPLPKKMVLNKEQEDAKNVLKTLGFKAKEIEDVLEKLPTVLTASEYVNEVLRRLGK